MLTKAVFICSYTVQVAYCTSELDKGFPNWGEETAANNKLNHKNVTLKQI